MSDQQAKEIHAATRLIYHALDPHAKAMKQSEYKELLAHYDVSPSFRLLVQTVADGLRLQILASGSLGMVLAAQEDSLFSHQLSFSRSSWKPDERLLDGLIHVAILSTIYPRAQDLIEDAALARPPITAEDVHATIQSLCTRLEQEAKDHADPSVQDIEDRMLAVWRVYQAKAAVSSKGRRGTHTTLSMIDHALVFLQDQGCFTLVSQQNKKAYRPTWRYQVLVQEWSATQLGHVFQSLFRQEK